MTEKKTLGFFPIDVYMWQNDDINNYEVIDYLESIPRIPYNPAMPKTAEQTVLYNAHLEQDERVAPVRDFILNCLEEHRVENNLDCDKLDITHMWANKVAADAGAYIPHHRHPFSYMTGIYYLTQAETIFEDPVRERAFETLRVVDAQDPHFNIQTASIECSPGTLLIFPSYLIHAVDQYLREDRWTIAFNVMPTGNVNRSFKTVGAYYEISECKTEDPT